MTTVQHSTLTAKAAAFAVRAHDGQVRRGTKFPYSSHPIGVGQILREYYPDRPTLEIAGYLHDVIEDTDYDSAYLALHFGQRVAQLVVSVTRDDSHDLGDYASDADSMRLKAADMIDNLRDTIRGFEKGHKVWNRFAAGSHKIQYWRDVVAIIGSNKIVAGEPIYAELRGAMAEIERWA